MDQRSYQTNAVSQDGVCCFNEEQILFTAAEDADEAFFSMTFSFSDWEDDAYIMMPACAYNGNRFRRVFRRYPPMYRPEECGADCDHLMTDLPALNPDGSGVIEVTAGDMAVPCVSIFFRHKKRAFMLFTEQTVKGKNIGFTVEAGKITLSFPANRTYAYHHCRPYRKQDDRGISAKKGECITSEYRVHEFPCESIPALYEAFFAKRKCLLSSPRAKNGYTKELWDLMEWHFNEHNWNGEVICSGGKTTFQPGWCGGAMSSYVYLKYGDERSKARAVSTLDHLTKYQFESGFFMGCIHNGVYEDDSFHTEGLKDLHLVRKSADVLYFLFKHFSVIEPKNTWVEMAKKCADALCLLYETYGTFGQFVNGRTGEMIVGASSSAMMAVGALTKAYDYFGIPRYLDVARRACDFYYENFTLNGYTTGGPGEILSCPDSESAFAMLESCIALYETEKDEKWLKYAVDAANQAASWVVTYTYEFPKTSEFGRNHINTVGSVFANVQNKHSAPGICTLSGDALYKLYQYTGNREYLELILDIAYFIPQCVVTEDRPLYSWDSPPKKLLPGFVNERVNMSDWETKRNIGSVFYGSCWCETTLVLSFAELLKYPEFREE